MWSSFADIIATAADANVQADVNIVICENGRCFVKRVCIERIGAVDLFDWEKNSERQSTLISRSS